MSSINFPQELVRGSFECLEEVIKSSEDSGTSQQLAEVLVQFAVHHSITEPLFQWLVRREITKTVFYSSVFREDCFAIQVLNTFLYSEKGTTFLKKLLTPIVLQCTELWKKDKRILQLTPNIPTKVFDANLAETHKAVEHFLVNLSFTIQTCPIPLRQAFAIIQATIEARFKDEITAETPPIGLDLFFFKFICPALINAQKFLPKTKSKIQPSLITISKLLNDLALNNGSRWGQKTAAFIDEKHPLLRSLFFTLIDREAMKTVEENVQVEVSIMSPICRDRSADKIREFVQLQVENQNINSAYEISSKLAVRKCEQFMRKVTRDDWTSHTSWPEVSIFKLKDDDESLCVKGHILIRAPVAFVMKCFLDFGQVVKRTTRSFLREPTENFKLERCVAKLPFPLTSRDAIISTWTIKSSNPDRAFFITEDASHFFPPQKGFVRSSIQLSGAMMQTDEEGNTMMIRMAHGSPNGSFPKWLVDLLTLEQCKRWKTFKKQVEKLWRKERLSLRERQFESVENSYSCESV